MGGQRALGYPSFVLWLHEPLGRSIFWQTTPKRALTCGERIFVARRRRMHTAHRTRIGFGPIVATSVAIGTFIPNLVCGYPPRQLRINETQVHFLPVWESWTP